MKSQFVQNLHKLLTAELEENSVCEFYSQTVDDGKTYRYKFCSLPDHLCQSDFDRFLLETDTAAKMEAAGEEQNIQLVQILHKLKTAKKLANISFTSFRANSVKATLTAFFLKPTPPPKWKRQQTNKTLQKGNLCTAQRVAFRTGLYNCIKGNFVL